MRRQLQICLLASVVTGGGGMAAAQTACPAYPVTLQNGTIADATEVMADLNTIRDCVNANNAMQSGGLVTGGSASAQTLTVSGLTAYAIGQRLQFKVGTGLTNTGAVTLNVNGLGTRTVVSLLGTGLLGGALQAGRLAEVLYDGTNFILVQTSGAQAFGGNGSDGAPAWLLQAQGGGGTNGAALIRQTTQNVGTSPATIVSPPGYGGLVIVVGESNNGTGGSVFQDVILCGYGPIGPMVIASMTGVGSPAGRSYASPAPGQVTLQMGSGTYAVAATMLLGGLRY